jgi:exosortase E/protease (VPEID-CTERM system)
LNTRTSAARRLPGSSHALRWLLPAGLLAAELGALTLIGNYPVSGSATKIVPAVGMALPVVLAATLSAWLMARSSALAPGPDAQPLPVWRPWPALIAHALAFAGLAGFTARLLGTDAPSVSAGSFVAWLACAGATGLLALGTAVPLRWILRAFALRWRVPLFALAAGLLTWRAMAMAESLWGIASSGSLRSVAWLLRLVADGVTVDLAERAIGIDGFQVEIASMCSGVDGVGLVVLFQAIWIALGRHRIRTGPALLLMLPLGATAALGGNVLRISMLLWLGASGREELALGAFHSKIGWLFFIAIALGSIAAAERLAWLQRPTSAPAEKRGLPAAASSYVAPLLGAIGTALVCGMLSQGAVDPAYGLRIAVPLLILVLVRRSLPAPSPRFSWPAALIGAAVSLAWVLSSRGDGSALTAELADMAPASRYSWIALRALGSSLVIPLVEELAFRGFLLPWLASPDLEVPGARTWSWPAAVLSSLAFGALHERWIAGALAGLAFAVAWQLRGRLGDAVLAHAICNAGIAGAVLLCGRWDLWT